MSSEITILPRSCVPALKHSLWAAAIVMTATLLACATQRPAQTAEKPVEVEASDNLVVPFLARAPVIDGSLDPGLTALAGVYLPVFRNRGANAPAAPAFARLAYGSDFLYVYVEAMQEGIQCRDRAYQKGDGIILALASPESGMQRPTSFRCSGSLPRPEAGAPGSTRSRGTRTGTSWGSPH